jgi:Putative beta-barrel porin 2
MILHRHWCAILAAGCFLTRSAAAQEGASATGVPRTGASSAFGPATPAPGTGTNPPGTGTNPPGTGPGGSSAFGTNPPGTGNIPAPTEKKPSVGGTPGTGEPGAASTFGEGEGSKPSSSSEPTFTIPGAYGRQAQTFTAGAGRLARPKFRYTGAISFGYDDNVQQAPTNSAGVPDVVVEVLDDPGTPGRLETGIGPNGEVITVVVAGRAPTTKKIVIPGVPGQERIGSFMTRGNVGFDVQFASRKTLFTFDLRTGAEVYWDRPGKDTDFTGSLALLYLRRLTPRLQFTANVAANYQTQPDLTQANTSTRQAGSFLSATSKADLSYRFTPRITAVASLSYNAISYEEESQQGNDYGETTFGTEVRYLFSPRLTLLGELRYSSVTYSTTSARDSSTVLLLLGGELTLSRRFSATLRVGAALRSFDESDDGSSTSPYFESTVSYQLAKATIIRFNGRFGFENPPDANSELISLRAGLNLVQSFSPRFRGTLGVNVVRQTTTSDLLNTELVENTVDSNIGFEYNLNRHWTLNANYTYITQFGSNPFAEYYRNRLFVGAGYDF